MLIRPVAAAEAVKKMFRYERGVRRFDLLKLFQLCPPSRR
jgi:hypothetical protein